MMKPLWKTVMWFLKKLKRELYNPAISILDIPPEKFRAGCERNISTSIFRAALFTLAKRKEETQMFINR